MQNGSPIIIKEFVKWTKQKSIIKAYEIGKGKATLQVCISNCCSSGWPPLTRRPGARMLITEAGGKLTGAISGRCLERRCPSESTNGYFSARIPCLVTYDTTDEDDAEIRIRLVCNGIIHVLIEPIDFQEWIEIQLHSLNQAVSDRELRDFLANCFFSSKKCQIQSQIGTRFWGKSQFFPKRKISGIESPLLGKNWRGMSQFFVYKKSNFEMLDEAHSIIFLESGFIRAEFNCYFRAGNDTISSYKNG